jgi:SAM-dependent methyltransferase
LEAHAGKALRPHRKEIAFVLADPAGADYPLPSRAFDLIASNAVVEHVADVPRFAAEIGRLLDAGGYFYAVIHNYYSLSGGHHLEWAFPDERPSRRVPPWDHLRANRFPSWMSLNRGTPEQYREALSRRLQILRFEGVGRRHDPGEPEGERFLTSEVAAELTAYPRGMLLTPLWCVVGRKA